MMRSGIRRRFVLAVGGIVAGAVLVLTLTVGFVGAQLLRSTQDTALLREASRVASLVRAQTDWVGSGYCEFASSPACTQVIDTRTPAGRSSSGLHITPAQLAVTDASSTDRRPYFSDDSIGSTRIRVVTVPLGDGRALITGSSSAGTDRAASMLFLVLSVAGAITVFGAAMTSAVVAHRIARPLLQLTERAEHLVSVRDPAGRTTIDRPDEVGRLAVAFDDMLDRLDAAETARRDLISDASHDLRSPLTALLTNFSVLERPDLPEALRRELLTRMKEEAMDMATLVVNITDLARADAGPLTTRVVPPGMIVDDAIAVTRRRWPTRSLLVRSRLGDASCTADPELLTRAVVNLLDNAMKYSAEDSEVRLESSADETSWWVSVIDQGPGIAETELPRIFERYERGEPGSRVPGSGIGLAMVRSTVERHDGGVEVTSAPGRGTTITIRLPIRAPHAHRSARTG
ncbi:HAMP domain-containing sensor histidine kinase [Plantibacter sp. VKM Ac-2876]|uniref:HAMP domain-containing sensor histidine kinase n=1 Tax=Plantibacter sp. VKM Ac-2876 TaxID=2783826 RepID=UPI001E2B87B6|nr:HAMP domain-containing sensor histidine kinase [Plantibacter sp. VKM Ac-2876]